MKDSIFNMIEKNDAQNEFDLRLAKDAMGQILGGREKFKMIDYAGRDFCDPWSDCDAWNCAPDCTCKSNLC